jgi:hypothetical protein
LLVYLWCRVEDLMRLMFDTVIPHFITSRVLKLSGWERNRLEEAGRRHAANVAALCEGQAFTVQHCWGLTSCLSQSQECVVYQGCIADASCTCLASRDDICKHLEAAASQQNLTTAMLEAAAVEIIRRQEAGELAVL